jgi:prevent-host-death family protein
MKVAAISEFKSKLARYLRLVKAGEQIEIQERGVPVAIVHPIKKTSSLLILQPRKKAALLGQMSFSLKPKMNFDIVKDLIEERKKR